MHATAKYHVKAINTMDTIHLVVLLKCGEKIRQGSANGPKDKISTHTQNGFKNQTVLAVVFVVVVGALLM